MGDDNEDAGDNNDGNEKLLVELSEKPIEIDIHVDPKFKAIRYELTSDGEIDPLDAAYCLWLIITNVCEKFGITPQELLGNYAKDLAHDGNQTKH